MKKLFQISLTCIFLSNLLNAQVHYTGSFDFKNQSEFNLSTESDTILIIVSKKMMTINDVKSNSFSIVKTKRNNYTLEKNGEKVYVSKTKRALNYSNGLSFTIRKSTSKHLIIADKNGKLVLSASYDFKYPNVQYKLTLYDADNFPELISYSINYLFEKSKDLKNAYESPYVYFGH